MRRLELSRTMVVLTLIAAGCAGAPTQAPTVATGTTPAASPTAGSTAPGSSALGEPETKSFKVAGSGIGVSTLPMIAAIDALNAQGWQIERVDIAAAELADQAVVNGQVQIARGSTPTTAALVLRGAPITTIIGAAGNEWALYSKADLTTCASLGGRKLAIHSEGSESTFMVRSWIQTQCPGTKPNEIILPESPNRLAALLAGQIDAAPLELGDGVTLESAGGARYFRLTSFAQSLSYLQTNLEASTTWAAANPNAVSAFLKAIVEQNRKFNSDPAYFKEQALKYIPGIKPETLDAVIKAFIDLKILLPNGGMETADQEQTVKFFIDFKMADPGLTAGKLFDRKYLDAALNSIGRQP